MTSFGELIRSYRLRAGLGLRTFATLIEQRASTVSAVESNQRAPWRRETTLHRVAEVLGLAESSSLWQKIVELSQKGARPVETTAPGALAWWWSSDGAPALDCVDLGELANFVGATIDHESSDATDASPEPLTELAIEWRVRRLLGRREAQLMAAPIDVEAALENEAGVRLVIMPGLIPRFSVQVCMATGPAGMTLFVDRIVADSRPLASYRHLLALCFAPASLWQAENNWTASHFRQLQADNSWAHRHRDCERFALAMLLPANPVLVGAETAYQELIGQQGWLEEEEAIRALRNRLAEQFAVPTSLVHRRLVGWPCHLYGRIAQALAAQELTFPPPDWFVEEELPRQQKTLFDLDVRA